MFTTRLHGHVLIHTVLLLVLPAWLLSSCGATADVVEDTSAPASPSVVREPTPQSTPPTDAEQRFPSIVDAKLTRNADGSYDIAVTISSAYDTPERYADGWRVLVPGGTVIGEHTLLHDHAAEQPFTRMQSGVRIPDGVQTVTIEGHDKQYGYGGKTLEVAVPR